MKQIDLAVALKRSQSMISMAETDQRSMPFEQMVQAARVLDVSLDWLGGLTDDAAPAADLARTARGATSTTQPPAATARIPVADRRLAELLSVIAGYYESHPDRRADLLQRLDDALILARIRGEAR